jgi:hypothetical protein
MMVDAFFEAVFYVNEAKIASYLQRRTKKMTENAPNEKSGFKRNTTTIRK